MMNRVIKRMQRGVLQQQHSQRPTLTRGNKSYSDSTMETVTSDQNSIPSNSTRDTLQNHSNSNHNNSSSHHNGSEEISEDDMTIHSNRPTISSPPTTSSSSKNRNDDSSTHHRLKKAHSVHIVKTNENIIKRKTAVCFASDYGSPPEMIESDMILSEEDLLDCFYTVRLSLVLILVSRFINKY
jgi:hypothetical protein